ncbi:tetratricopeptide (TPR) repeat protein [Weissella uvarum]|uniref:tetratricopeptide repeat protein n=1 Tax=Weissella uvarum TaxID=1479233 RepID=UPI001960E050|nr:tetratricopeptide repeat protein [Weissella uvarum]MBM7617052.1 tetratricopeptide (TPR) repeat protein [Weissella uvarum]MCM0595350.1 tetratricopeptide repeat protein [Weissella uvarum]
MASYAERMLDELELGQTEAAKKSYALSLRHDDDDTIYSLAEELYGLGFINQAKRAYKKLLDKYPDADELRTALADIAVDEDDAETAVNYLAEIKPDSDAYLQALLVMADLYQSEGIYEAAEGKLKEAYELAPTEPVILFALGEYYFAIADYRQAIPYYRTLLEQGERFFSGLDIASRIGVAYALVGDVDRALGYLEQIDASNMTSDVRFQLAMLYATDEETRDKAIDGFEELKKLDPDYATLYEPLGELYETEHKDEQALETYQAGLAIDQYNPKMYERAAIVSERLGESQEAQSFFKEGLEHNPEDTTLTLDYSDWLTQHEQYEENINLINDYFEDEEADMDPAFYRNLAQSYAAIEDFEMADRYYQAALPFFETDATFLKEAYYFFREAGERNFAKETLSLYLKLVPDDYEMLDEQEQLALQDNDDDLY